MTSYTPCATTGAVRPPVTIANPPSAAPMIAAHAAKRQHRATARVRQSKQHARRHPSKRRLQQTAKEQFLAQACSQTDDADCNGMERPEDRHEHFMVNRADAVDDPTRWRTGQERMVDHTQCDRGHQADRDVSEDAAPLKRQRDEPRNGPRGQASAPSVTTASATTRVERID